MSQTLESRALEALNRLSMASILFAVAAVSFVVITGPNLGAWDGKLQPVAVNVHIDSELHDSGVARLATITFDKVRACEFKYLAIYWKDTDNSFYRIPWENITQEPVRADQDRPTGKNVAHIKVLTKLPHDRWHVETRHQCYASFIPLTRTVIWP